MTEAEFLQQLQNCDYNDSFAVSKLVTSSYTNVMFNDKVTEMQINNPQGAQNYFGGFFGTKTWADGQGNDMIREYATDPMIPFTFSHFVRQMPVCDPNLANACNFDLCEVPEGGRGTMPGMQWVRWGFKTKRSCIANIRHIRDFQYWAAKVIRNRTLIDEQVMNMFYVMVAIKTAGHKITMQGIRDSNGNLSLIPSTNPRNQAGFGLYNYMQELFPQPTNINDMVPIDFSMLDRLARRWTQFNAGNSVATGPRGERIFEMWHPDDIFQQEVLRNPDYMKSLAYTMPNSQFAGYSLVPGDAEIIKNWRFKIMPWLPRFAPNADGQLVPVDSHVNVEIEVGSEPVPSSLFEDAPIGLSLIVSGRQGNILTRPTLSQSGDGIPILPIASSEPWQINNHYDAICNEFLNQPFSYRRYEMGWELEDPNASMGFLFRRRVFQPLPINDCDLAPIFTAPSNEIDCPITTIGCGGGQERIEDGITQAPQLPTRVECFAAFCSTPSSPYMYNIQVKRIPNQPDFNSLGCACGAAVTLFVHDANGVFVREQQGILKDDIKSFPYGLYVISTLTQLTSGQCIKYITCSGSTPLQANAVTSWDATTNPGYNQTGVGFILESPMGCGGAPANDAVLVKYYDEDGLVLLTINGTIVEADIDRNYYRITGTNIRALGNPNVVAGAAYIGVSCNEAPNASSSSSGQP